ncbi:MAG: hypothetical protein QM820_65280 [Minicystis sp.]
MSTQKTVTGETIQNVGEDDDFDVDVRLDHTTAKVLESPASPFCTATCNESCGVTCSCINC